MGRCLSGKKAVKNRVAAVQKRYFPPVIDSFLFPEQRRSWAEKGTPPR
jgi:hypothetical protein